MLNLNIFKDFIVPDI